MSDLDPGNRHPEGEKSSVVASLPVVAGSAAGIVAGLVNPMLGVGVGAATGTALGNPLTGALSAVVGLLGSIVIRQGLAILLNPLYLVVGVAGIVAGLVIAGMTDSSDNN